MRVSEQSITSSFQSLGYNYLSGACAKYGFEFSRHLPTCFFWDEVSELKLVIALLTQSSTAPRRRTPRKSFRAPKRTPVIYQNNLTPASPLFGNQRTSQHTN
jgi:hypothetical protein